MKKAMPIVAALLLSLFMTLTWGCGKKGPPVPPPDPSTVPAAEGIEEGQGEKK